MVVSGFIVVLKKTISVHEASFYIADQSFGEALCIFYTVLPGSLRQSQCGKKRKHQ